MSSVFEFVAESRELLGKTAAKAARRNGEIPAVVYGGEAEPITIVIAHNEVLKHLAHEAVYSHVLDLRIDGKTEKAVLKDIQRHPARPQILHMDFMRVDATHSLKVNVPLHFVNESISEGVKVGGVVTHAMVDVEVACMPSALPEYIEVDLAGVGLGETIHLSDIVLPEGVEIPVLLQGEDHDHMVAQIIKTRGPQEDDDELPEEEDGEGEE